MKRIMRGALGLAAISGGAQQAAGSRVGSETQFRDILDVEQIYSGRGVNPLVFANCYNRADADGDGLLSLTEFEHFNLSIEASMKEVIKEQLNRTMFNYESPREVCEQIQRKLLDLARVLSDIFPMLVIIIGGAKSIHLVDNMTKKIQALKHDLDIEKEQVANLNTRMTTETRTDDIEQLKRAYLDRVSELCANVRIAERKALDAELLSTGYKQALNQADDRIQNLEQQLEMVIAELVEKSP